MRTTRVLTSCVCLALAWTQARPAAAQAMLPSSVQPSTTIPVLHMMQAPTGPQAPTTPQAPVRPVPPDPAAPPPVFGEAAPAGTEAPGGAYAPQMMGDSLFTFGAFRPRIIGIPQPGQQIISGLSLGVFQGGEFSVPIPIAAALSAFKIADNESARPQDRAYLNFDYYTNVFHSTIAEGTDTHVRIGRQVFGYEKTLLDGDMSIGLRLPFFQIHSSTTVPEDDAETTNYSDFGDVSIITKFVLLRDCECGNLLSGGVVLTLPTGPTYMSGTLIDAVTGATLEENHKINPTFLQPWLGFIRNYGEDYYIHGFSALAFAFDDSVEPTWFNDIGLGWYAYRGSCSCPAIIPTAELHVTTPFGNRGLETAFPVAQIDTFITTLGTHLHWQNRANLTLGVAFPWSGPQPFSSELIAQFNFLY